MAIVVIEAIAKPTKELLIIETNPATNQIKIIIIAVQLIFIKLT